MIPIHYSDKGLYLYYDSYSDLPQKPLYVYIRMSTGYYIYKSGRKKNSQLSGTQMKTDQKLDGPKKMGLNFASLLVGI